MICAAAPEDVFLIIELKKRLARIGIRRPITNRVFRGSRRGGWTAESAERAAKRGTRGMPTELACNVRRGRPRKAAEGRGRSRKVGVIQSAQQGTKPVQFVN